MTPRSLPPMKPMSYQPACHHAQPSNQNGRRFWHAQSRRSLFGQPCAPAALFVSLDLPAYSVVPSHDVKCWSTSSIVE
jgi:hypothetical protein